MKRGDLYLCDFGQPVGHEQGHRRPVMILSATEFAATALAIVLPLTRSMRGYATQVENEQALPFVSYVQCEQIRLVSIKRFIRRVGTVDALDLVRVEEVVRRVLVL